jgi:hypothetical protein
MDADLIRVVNKLQDTFATLGGDLDMPQIVAVCENDYMYPQDANPLCFRSVVSPPESLVC